MNQKPSNMSIAGVEPRQLAPTVGTMGSGFTGSPAPSSPSTMSRSHPTDSPALLIINGKSFIGWFTAIGWPYSSSTIASG
jgi:hypothetical protein